MVSMQDPDYDWSKDPNHPFIKYAAMFIVFTVMALIVYGALAVLGAF